MVLMENKYSAGLGKQYSISLRLKKIDLVKKIVKNCLNYHFFTEKIQFSREKQTLK